MLCCFRLDLEGKTGIDVSDAKDNSSKLLNRGSITDLS